jgi:hypothetical protein
MIALFVLAAACTKREEPKKPEEPAPINADLDPAGAKIKERGEQLTKELARQKEIKASIPQMSLIEKFTRETSEREILFNLGEPETVKNLKVENSQQRVFYYKKDNFAIWLWRESDNSGPYQFRAAVSLKNGKFDMPLHNVLNESELKMTQANVEE